MITKGDLAIGAFKFLRISGITVDASPEEVADCIQVCDDLAAELKNTVDIGYIQPVSYGDSDANDNSGLSPEAAAPFKKVVAQEIAVFFGKELTPTLNKITEQGMRRLEDLFVVTKDAQNPPTLPIGSGNECSYRSDKFYPEPNNDDGAINYYQSDVFQQTIDWSSWLGNCNELDTVTYEKDSGIDLSSEDIYEGISNVTVSFNSTGQFVLCAKATDLNGNSKTKRFVYNSNDCKNQNRYYL